LLADNAGADVHLTIREEDLKFRSLHAPGEWLYRNLFKQSRRLMSVLPGLVQDRLLSYLLEGTAEPALEERLEQSNITLHVNASIVQTKTHDAKLTVNQPGKKPVPVDYVIVATGFNYDITKIGMLESLPIKRRGGLPILNRYAMSSMPGLSFAGMSALRLVGPQCQFVSGSGILSPLLAVICYLVGATQPGDTGEIFAAILIVTRLLLSDYTWISKISGRIALVVLMVSIFINFSSGTWFEMYEGFERYVGVVILVLSISFLRLPLKYISLSAPYRLQATGLTGTPLAMITTISSAISPLLNLGTIALFGGMLDTEGRQAITVSGAVTRGVGAALLISPTFAPTAIVLSEFPDVTWISTLPLAVPLFIATLIMAWSRQKGQSVTWITSERHGRPSYHLGIVIVLMGLLLVFFRSVAHWSIVMSVSSSAIASVYLWAYAIAGRTPDAVTINPQKQTATIWPSIEAEAALFIVAGILAATLSTNVMFHDFVQSYIDTAASPLPLFLTILIGMPVITILGIHPIVPFVILVNLIDGHDLGLTAPAMYVLWVVSWVLSMMVSPVSALNISAATFFNVSPWAIGLRENVPYAMAFGAISLALFSVIGGK